MSHYLLRGAVALGVLVASAATPAISEACWFTSCFGHHSTYRPWWGASTAPAPAPVAYAPAPCAPACAPACNPCPTTCCYVPQTCYRQVCENVPVTSYRPVTTCDPCTGCPTTAMVPTTSYVQQTRMVPYTTYRPVYTASYAPSCSTCTTPATSYYAPAATYPQGCAGCAPATPAVPYGAPAASPGPATETPMQAPSLPTTSLNGTTNRFARPALPQTSNDPSGLAPLKPVIPADNSKSGTKSDLDAPQLIDPQNRTAATNILTKRGWGYIPLARPAHFENDRQSTSTVETDGWRAQ